MATRLSEFDYKLPKELIAQFPLEKREQSRLLVFDRKDLFMKHDYFYSIVDYLNKGDILVLNNTKVILARLFARRKHSRGKVELLLLEEINNRRFRALISPIKRLKANEELPIESNNGLTFKLIDFANRIVEFNQDNVMDKLRSIGHVPLPKYIKRSDVESDRVRYQTVYAKEEGAVAAPTAGLHFTDSLLKRIKDKGVNVTFLTLHVGYGTFASIREQDISRHKMEEEHFEIPESTISLIRNAKKNKAKVVAVGTTVCRALESCKDLILSDSIVKKSIKGKTNLFIYPSFKFSLVDSLITNFHLPKSTLYILVSAFVGLSNMRRIYKQAIEKNYRFFSYGDAMIIK